MLASLACFHVGDACTRFASFRSRSLARTSTPTTDPPPRFSPISTPVMCTIVSNLTVTNSVYPSLSKLLLASQQSVSLSSLVTPSGLKSWKDPVVIEYEHVLSHPFLQ